MSLAKYAPWIEKAEGVVGVYVNITHPLQEAVRQIEMNGVFVDKTLLLKLAKECEEKIEAKQREFWEEAGVEVYYQSPAALGRFLYEELKLVCPLKTTSGGNSTALPALEKLKGKHPSIEPLMELKRLTKLKKDFLDGNGKAQGLLPFIQSDGRCHSNYRIDGTESGRLSASQPNLMNIPKTPDNGELNIRSMFRARPGYVIIEADYNQLELRIISYVTDDKKMQAAFNSGADFHAVTAAVMFDCAVEDVTYRQRTLAKAINFGVAYGMGEYTLSFRLGIPIEEAEAYISAWFMTYRMVRKWLKTHPVLVSQVGYAETIFGRRRHLPELKSGNSLDPNWKKRQSHLVRTANNFPIQSTGSDILSLATISLVSYPFQEFVETGAIPIMSLHDALFFEVPEKNAATAAFIIKDVMQNLPKEVIGPKWNLRADVKIGSYWGDDHSAHLVAG